MPSVRLNHALRQKYERAWQRLVEARAPRVWDASAVHRSDLDHCIRASYFRYSGAPGEWSANTLLVFMRGEVLHEILTAGGTLEFERVVEGIVSHVDERLDGEDVEKKTTRTKYIEPPDFGVLMKDKKGTIKSPWGQSWMMEAAYVAAHRDDRTVNFMVLHLNGDYAENRDWMLSGPWEYTFTEAECQQASDWFRQRRVALVLAMETRTPPGVKYRLGDWECGGCPFKSLCVDALTNPNSGALPIPMFETEG